MSSGVGWTPGFTLSVQKGRAQAHSGCQKEKRRTVSDCVLGRAPSRRRVAGGAPVHEVSSANISHLVHGSRRAETGAGNEAKCSFSDGNPARDLTDGSGDCLEGPLGGVCGRHYLGYP